MTDQTPKPPQNPIPFLPIIEWGSIGFVVVIFSVGAMLLFPLFQKFQTLPKDIATLQSRFNQKLSTYQETAKDLGSYREALSSYPQELTVVSKMFWSTPSEGVVSVKLQEKGLPLGVQVDHVLLREDLRAQFPHMRVFDVEISGNTQNISDFERILTTEAPFGWVVASAPIRGNGHRITTAFLDASTLEEGDVSKGFANDLYSYSKFRILKESLVE